MRAIGSIKARLLRLLTDDVVIERPVSTIGYYGAPLTTFETDATVKGRLITQGKINASFAVSGNMLTQREPLRVALPPGTTIEAGWRLRIRGDLYRVVAVREHVTDSVDTQAWVEQWGNES
jgi:hypothetical protein